MEPKSSFKLSLPKKLSRQAPTCFEEDKLWFDEFHSLDCHKEADIEKALVTLGIGEHKCPTVAKWATFSIAGAVIATLTDGLLISPPKPEPMFWVNDIEFHIWEFLWKSYEENKEKLNKTFMATMLSSFIPRDRKKYYSSSFLEGWIYKEYPDTLSSSVGNLRISKIKEGEAALKRLEPEVVTSIKEVAENVPPMLEISIERIKRTYNW